MLMVNFYCLMAQHTSAFVVVILLFACTQGKLIDEFWRNTVISNGMTLTLGNLTVWKALACCADNDTVRPQAENRLINYINTTWCKGNTTCMQYIPKGDTSFVYQETKNTQGNDFPATSPYFWLWLLKSSQGSSYEKYLSCNQDYFPRFDWWYLCQAFMPAVANNWYYGARWFCGSNNPYGTCIVNYKLPVGKVPLFNMTGLIVGAGTYAIACCF